MEDLADHRDPETLGGSEMTPERRVDILALLREGELGECREIPWSSNCNFTILVERDGIRCLAVYKPRAGETPLWDFPDGTLCLREYAAFLVSQALGWGLVPPTVLREGEYGLGTLQLAVDVDPQHNFFTLRDEHAAEFQRLAVFDYIVNNSDRKGGHCLCDRRGRVWAIDHGLTFHHVPKVRTVIWDWSGEHIPRDIIADVQAFRPRLDAGPLREALDQLLTRTEVAALRRRTDRILKEGRFPLPGPDRNVPWPPI